MEIILQTIYQNAFPWKKKKIASNLTAVCSEGFNWEKVIIGSGNGLATNKVTGWNLNLFNIGRTRRHGYLDHAFIPHCTIFSHLRAKWGAIMHHWTQPQHQTHFHTTLPIMVIEIQLNFQICVQCAEKTFLKSLSISHEILSKYGILGTPEYQRVTSKSSRMGSEWPDKHNKTGFGSVARDGGKFFHMVILPNLTVWALGWFEYWECSPYDDATSHNCQCRNYVEYG